MSTPSSRQAPPASKTRRALSEQLHFLGQMASTETAFFHHAAATKNGLTVTDSKTISALMQEGPMTAGQLAIRLNLTTGAITSVIDRLEKVNLAERVADPSDRRKVVVKVIQGNLVKIGSAYESIGRAFQELLKCYSLEQLQFLVDYHQASVALTRGEIAKLAAGKDQK